MTISTTFSNELPITKVVQRAYNLSGLQPPEASNSGIQWQARQAVALDFLQIILDEIASEGVFARAVKFTNITLVSGTFVYSLPDNVLEVIGNGAYIDPTNLDITKASVETPVLQKDREFWQSMSAKAASSRPTVFFNDRASIPTSVRLWPVPGDSEAGGTVRFQVQQLSADVSDATKTLDLQRYWLPYMVWALGGYLATSANKDAKGQSMLAKAEQLKEQAKAKSTQNTANSFNFAHSTGWGP